MLKQRVITALVLASAFIGALFFGPSWGFTLFVGVFFFAAAWEWANLSGVTHSVARVAYSVFIVGLTYLFCSYSPLNNAIPLNILLLVGCLWWLVAFVWVKTYPKSAVVWGSNQVRMLMGILVLVPTGLALDYLYSSTSGAWLILLLFIIVATADIGAYFSGRAFGRRKLAKTVSPGKSWEGVAGGLVAVSIFAVIYSVIWPTYGWASLLLVVVPTALASVLGDLLESMVKRHRGIKDSSQLLPGHGGVLDRIDGVTAAAPIFALALMSLSWVK